ncbi:MAG: hypothetical protein ABEK50_18555 [bacterium]
MTLIFGERESRMQPEDDYKFQDGIPPWDAAVGSMSLPPYYEPYKINDPPEEVAPVDGESIVLIDGETRDPFSTDAAMDSGVDLVFVSSFYRVHEYTPDLGHISDYGTVPVMFQERAQARDANKHNSIENRKRRKDALKEYKTELRKVYDDPEIINEKMKRMEDVLGMRQDVDVVEIQAQDYLSDVLTYPYWDPFSLNRDVLEFQYDAGYSVANSALEESVPRVD